MEQALCLYLTVGGINVTEIKSDAKEVNTQIHPNCSVNMKFNFTIGGIAIVITLLIGYFIYLQW